MDREIVLTVIYTFLAFLAMSIAIIVFVYYSRKKILIAQIQKKVLEIEYQKKLLESTILSQEQERKRIARDLHDAISSKLNVVSLNAQLVKNSDITQNEKQHLLESIISQSKEVTENARQIAHNLLPPVLEKFGLQAALEELCYEFNATKEIRILLSGDLQIESFAQDKQLHVFRIIQELVNNSIKHGKAKEVAINFIKSGDVTRCIYSDNGAGFDSAVTANKTGLGLNNIQSRLKLMQSELHIKSNNNGVVITFNF